MRLPPPLHLCRDEFVWQWDSEVDNFDLMWYTGAAGEDEPVVQLIRKAIRGSLSLSEQQVSVKQKTTYDPVAHV